MSASAWTVVRGGDNAISGALASGVADARLAVECDRLNSENDALRRREALQAAVWRSKRKAALERARRTAEVGKRQALRTQRRAVAWAIGTGFALGVCAGWAWWWITLGRM